MATTRAALAYTPCCSTHHGHATARTPAAARARLWRGADGAVRPAVLGRRRAVRVRASEAEGSEPAPGAMDLSPAQAMELLGVGRNASFEEIVRAKNRLVEATDDMETVIRVDAAYDLLLMQSFRSRQSGTTAGDNIKYADVSKPKPPQLPSWAKSGLDKLPSAGTLSVPTVSAVSGDDATKQAAVFAVLLLWSTVQGLSDPNIPGANVPSTQLALAYAACIYFLRDHKRVTLPRAFALTTGGLVAGALMGSALQAWLRVDIVPLGPLDTPEVLISELALLAIATTCALLV